MKKLSSILLASILVFGPLATVMPIDSAYAGHVTTASTIGDAVTGIAITAAGVLSDIDGDFVITQGDDDIRISTGGGTGGGSSRSLNWEAEVSRWLKEAVEPNSPFDLKGLGLGLLANFPIFLHGRGRESNAIGSNAPIAAFNGVDLFKVIQHTLRIGVGDAAETDFGNEALTQGDPAANNYGNTGSDGEAIPVPTGAATPAFVLSNADGGGFNLSATDGILTIIVDGVPTLSTSAWVPR